MIAGTYDGDRAWAERFMPEVRSIIGPLLLVPGDLEQDRREATDLIVLTGRDMRIGVRMRRPGAYEKWPYDFTIRRARTNGARTEMDKIIDGWGDWLFYGHGDDAGKIVCWWLIDLDALRSQLIRSETRCGKRRTIRNKDQATEFTAFDLRYFKPGILIAGSERVDFCGWPAREAVHA